MQSSLSVRRAACNIAAVAAPALSPAAAKALATDPAEIVRRWIASVSEDAQRAYRRALATFTAWAMPEATDPHAELAARLKAHREDIA